MAIDIIQKLIPTASLGSRLPPCDPANESVGSRAKKLAGIKYFKKEQNYSNPHNEDDWDKADNDWQ